jgi:beta-glucanase (GH16 family)
MHIPTQKYQLRTDWQMIRIFVLSFCLFASIFAFGEDAKLSPSNSIFLKMPKKTAVSQCEPLKPNINYQSIQFKQTFHEDFNQLDTGPQGWSTHYDGGYDKKNQKWLGYDHLEKRTLKGNQEQQIYVDSSYKGANDKALNLDPFEVLNGILTIRANKTPDHLTNALYGYEYYSGLITTRKFFSQQYGYFEMRAKIPSGKAIWPAFWMLPIDKSWPPELDIVEVVGQQPEVIVTTVHSGSVEQVKSSGCRTRLNGAYKEFHLYGAYWGPEKITYFIDREPIAEIATPSEMNKPMYILLNLAVGGKMVGRADSETPLTAKFEIDWVSAYQLQARDK